MIKKGKLYGTIPVLILSFLFFAGCATDTQNTTETQKTQTQESYETSEETPMATERENEEINTRDTREMDIIMFYDIDIGPTTNERPENGWWRLNPWHPDRVEQDGHFRTTTPLLGLYDCRDPQTAYQHAYWMSAMGVNAIAVDFTNYSSPRAEGAHPGLASFWEGIFKNTEVLMQTLSGIDSFDAPAAYPVMRLSGLSPAENPDEADEAVFRLAMDDVYELYEKYPEVWYKFDDGTPDAQKPFITIFAHWGAMVQWGENPPFEDDRFNIRWSNGYLKDLTTEDENGFRKIEENMPYWLFVEAEQKRGERGSYLPYYKLSHDGQRIEQMMAWVSLHLGGLNWDAMNNRINGQYTFTRSVDPVYDFMPQALLLGRWNYPQAWLGQPQEGLSLYESSHIEPNKDFGFKIFDIVTEHMYALNSWKRKVPPAPEVTKLDTENFRMAIDITNYPLEYRMSENESFEGEDWIYLNVAGGGIIIPENIDIEEGVYIQTRNTFGESEISFYIP